MLIAIDQTITTPDVYVAYCIHVIMWVEIIRLVALLLGAGVRIQDRSRPRPLIPATLWDWAAEGGWPA